MRPYWLKARKVEHAGCELRTQMGSPCSKSYYVVQQSSGSVQGVTQRGKFSELRRNRAAQAVGLQVPARRGEKAVARIEITWECQHIQKRED